MQQRHCGWYVEDNILLDSEIDHLKKGLSLNYSDTAFGERDFGTNNLELLDVIITNPLFNEFFTVIFPIQ